MIQAVELSEGQRSFGEHFKDEDAGAIARDEGFDNRASRIGSVTAESRCTTNGERVVTHVALRKFCNGHNKAQKAQN
jgi:hypothetical protein